jgi:acyl-CoA thioester hydrolase
MPPSDRRLSTITLFARFCDTDATGAVHHAQYLTWMEEARMQLARDAGLDYRDFMAVGTFLATTGVEIKYRRSVQYHDELQIVAWVEAMQSRGLRCGFEINARDGQTCYATAFSDHLLVNREGKPTVLPKDWKDRLLQADGAVHSA